MDTIILPKSCTLHPKDSPAAILSQAMYTLFTKYGSFGMNQVDPSVIALKWAHGGVSGVGVSVTCQPTFAGKNLTERNCIDNYCKNGGNPCCKTGFTYINSSDNGAMCYQNPPTAKLKQLTCRDEGRGNDCPRAQIIAGSNATGYCDYTVTVEQDHTNYGPGWRVGTLIPNPDPHKSTQTVGRFGATYPDPSPPAPFGSGLLYTSCCSPNNKDCALRACSNAIPIPDAGDESKRFEPRHVRLSHYVCKIGKTAGETPAPEKNAWINLACPGMPQYCSYTNNKGVSQKYTNRMSCVVGDPKNPPVGTEYCVKPKPRELDDQEYVCDNFKDLVQLPWTTSDNIISQYKTGADNGVFPGLKELFHINQNYSISEYPVLWFSDNYPGQEYWVDSKIAPNDLILTADMSREMVSDRILNEKGPVMFYWSMKELIWPPGPWRTMPTVTVYSPHMRVKLVADPNSGFKRQIFNSYQAMLVNSVQIYDSGNIKIPDLNNWQSNTEFNQSDQSSFVTKEAGDPGPYWITPKGYYIFRLDTTNQTFTLHINPFNSPLFWSLCNKDNKLDSSCRDAYKNYCDQINKGKSLVDYVDQACSCIAKYTDILAQVLPGASDPLKNMLKEDAPCLYEPCVNYKAQELPNYITQIKKCDMIHSLCIDITENQGSIKTSKVQQACGGGIGNITCEQTGCDNNFKCVNKECVPTCESDSQCFKGKVCRNGACQEPRSSGGGGNKTKIIILWVGIAVVIGIIVSIVYFYYRKKR